MINSNMCRQGTELEVRPPVLASDGDTSLDAPVEYALISEGTRNKRCVFAYVIDILQICPHCLISSKLFDWVISLHI